MLPAANRVPLQARLANLRIRQPRTFSSPVKCSFSSARGVRSCLLSRPAPLPAAFLRTPPAAPSHRPYSSSAMATKIDGTAIAKGIREGLKTEIEQTQAVNPRFKPNLVIFQGMFSWRGSFTRQEKKKYRG